MPPEANCLFCQANGPFNTLEHVIPESLGNNDLLLVKEVCDKCQNYFGKEVERYVLAKTPIAFWRVFLGIETKARNFPSIDLSQPRKESGIYPSTHQLHDDIGYTFHEDGSVSVDIDDPQTIRSILDGSRNDFRLVISPKMLFMMGRFFCKVGIEILCVADPEKARSESFLNARNYARHGKLPRPEGFGQDSPSQELWPLLHYSKGSPSDFRRDPNDSDLEEVVCYSYSLHDFRGEYTLFQFGMGTDHFVISLDRPFPHPVIREIFPGTDLRLIWYGRDQWKRPPS